jgi:H+/Cl- antiporter ClcA
MQINIPALIAALIGLALFSITLLLGNKIQNKWLRYLSAIIGLVISLLIMSSMPSLLGDSSTKTASIAGTYFVYLIIGFAVLKIIFVRKKM